MGDIEIRLFPDVAPKTVANFDSLVSIDFYDGTAFHRVIPGFMIQGGDPNTKNRPDDKSTWGMGDPSQKTVPAEFSGLKHKRGILSMARKGGDINSATSQFFIMHDDSPNLDGQYTIFGEVTNGMEVVDKITEVPKEGPHRSAPVQKITMQIEKINK
ncbi:MAG: peptidylprolyl isomerase [Bacteroidota bacterium]